MKEVLSADSRFDRIDDANYYRHPELVSGTHRQVDCMLNTFMMRCRNKFGMTGLRETYEVLKTS